MLMEKDILSQADVEIRRVEGDEALDILYEMGGYAFNPSPPFREKGPWREIVGGRKEVTYYALFENGVPAATVAGSPMTQQVRGQLYPMTGIWGVVTLPQFRHKGYSRAALEALLAYRRAYGDVFSCLYPFRESFYARLGYVTFPRPRWFQFSPTALAPLLKMNLDGEVRRCLTIEGLDTYLGYVRETQHRMHGFAMFDHPNKIAIEKFPGWLAIAKVDGQVEGVMLYKLEGDNVTDFTMRVFRFYAHTPQGRYLLLDWIARHIDQASQVKILLPPMEHPETWFLDLDAKIEGDVRSPMGRVLDVAALGGMQVEPGRFSVEISDPLCPWNEGCWQFEAHDGVLQVAECGSADFSLTIQGLSALVYGSNPVNEFWVHGWGNPPPQHQSTMQAMFPTCTVYLHDNF